MRTGNEITKNVEEELHCYFEKLDIPNNWNIGIDEAVQIALENEKISLAEDTIVEYIDLLANNFEFLAYERSASNFNYVDFRPEQLEEILMLSPYAKRKLRGPYINLSQSTEITLKDGSRIPINQHLLKSKAEDKPEGDKLKKEV